MFQEQVELEYPNPAARLEILAATAKCTDGKAGSVRGVTTCCH